MEDFARRLLDTVAGLEQGRPTKLGVDSVVRAGRRAVRIRRRIRMGTAALLTVTIGTLSAYTLTDSPPPRRTLATPSASATGTATPASSPSPKQSPSMSAQPSAATSQGTKPATPGAVTVADILADMAYPAGYPAHGIPDWSVSHGGSVSKAFPPPGWVAGVALGSIYRECLDVARCVAGSVGYDSGDVNTRIAITGFKAYMLHSDHTWTLLSGGPVTGAHYPEDFKGTAIPADLRNEPGGAVSDIMPHNRTLLFWPATRFQFDPATYAGIYITFQVRLIVDDPSKPDDRASARYLASASGDWWKTLTARACGPDCADSPIMSSRFKRITNNWTTVNATTLDAATLNAYPPPGVGRAGL